VIVCFRLWIPQQYGSTESQGKLLVLDLYHMNVSLELNIFCISMLMYTDLVKSLRGEIAEDLLIILMI